MRRRDGDAICESTGRDFRFPLRNQKVFRKGMRGACAPASAHGKTAALWFRKAWRCPRALEALEYDSAPFCRGLKRYLFRFFPVFTDHEI